MRSTRERGSALLLVVPLDHERGHVERLARVEHPGGAAADDEREALGLPELLDDPLELLHERPLEALLVDLELPVELAQLAVDLVAHLGEVELLLVERVVREHELLGLELLFEGPEAVEHRLDLRLRVALLARELVARRLALVGGADRLFDVDDPDLDALLLLRGRRAPDDEGGHRRRRERPVYLHRNPPLVRCVPFAVASWLVPAGGSERG